jgi:hypothetical protein
MLGMTRGVIEALVRQPAGVERIDDTVSEMLQVALRGVLA